MPPATKPAPAVRKSTALPTVGLGPCLYLSAPGEAPAAAIVTRPGSTVSLIVFPPESKIGVPRDTVRYVGDPDLPKYAHLNLGCWDFTDEQKLLRALSTPTD